MDTQLKGKVVLITGVNNPYGIGAATAKAFAAEGARVFGTYLPLPVKTAASGRNAAAAVAFASNSTASASPT